MAMMGIAIQALIAILVAFASLGKNVTTRQRWLIRSVALAIFLGAIVSIIQQKRDGKRRATEQHIQQSMAESLNALKKENEEEKNVKRLDADRKEAIRKNILPLLKEGIEVKNRCSEPGSQASATWTRKVERSLHNIDQADEEEFKQSEAPLICYESMSIEMGALQKILDKHN